MFQPHVFVILIQIELIAGVGQHVNKSVTPSLLACIERMVARAQ
jgi:hypothetical protein